MIFCYSSLNWLRQVWSGSSQVCICASSQGCWHQCCWSRHHTWRPTDLEHTESFTGRARYYYWWWKLGHCSEISSHEAPISFISAGLPESLFHLQNWILWVNYMCFWEFHYNASMPCSYTWWVTVGRETFLHKWTSLPAHDFIRSLAFWIVQLQTQGHLSRWHSLCLWWWLSPMARWLWLDFFVLGKLALYLA